MFRISLIAAAAAPITSAAYERLHHVSVVEAALPHVAVLTALIVLLLLGCLFVYVVSRLHLLKEKARWLERALGKIEVSRARYKALVNSINDLIVIIDTEGYILYSNEKAVEFTGMEQVDLLGMSVRVILGSGMETSPDSAKDDDICNFMAKNLFNSEFSMPTTDGGVRWISCKCMPLKEREGVIKGFILTMSDISDIKIKERELIAAKEAAELGNRAKSAFLANMSHELRTPLSSILGYSQFLDMQKAGPLNEKQRKYLNNIIASGDHLLEMVNDVLDLSKIEAGKVVIDKKPFDVNLMLMRSPSTIKAVADKNKVIMTLNIQKNMGVLHADEVRLKQVVYNLLGNAIKFTEPGKHVGIDAFAMGSTVIISVWDEGCGIEPEDQERIFLPFEQTERHRRQGTGLGLSIVKKIVELHGGTISVASVPGSGSRFSVIIPGRIELPAIDERELDQRAVPNAPEMKGKSILLVDGNDQLTTLITDVLESYGHGVMLCRNGEEAIALIERGAAPDIILMDIGLPNLESKNLLNRIKGSVDSSVPIIALTGYAMKGDRERFLTIGFDDYMSKPFRIESFVSKVKVSMVN